MKIPMPLDGRLPSMIDRFFEALERVEAVADRMEAIERQRAERTRREAGITSADMDAIG